MCFEVPFLRIHKGKGEKMEKHLDTEYQKQLQQKKHMMMKKKRKRRMKRRIIVFLFLLVCAGIIFTAFKAPFFDITEIICQGQDKLTVEQVIKIAGINKGDNIFSTSIQGAEEKLKSNPEIKGAAVNRVFPNEIRIEIQEAEPTAYVEHSGMFLMIDEDGKIVKNIDGKKEKLPDKLVKVIGIEVAASDPGKLIAAEDDGRAQKLYDCLKYLNSLGLKKKVDYVDFSDLSDIKLEYESRIYMLLGNYDSLEYKLKFVKKVIDEKISKQEKAKFDFRTDQLHVSTRDEIKQKEADVSEGSKENEQADKGKNADSEKKPDEEKKTEDKKQNESAVTAEDAE